MKLSIIIVNYNVCYFLEQALLAAQRAANSISSEIFVVDNNSKDGSVEMVKEKFPTVRLIANSHNPGFSKANNQAIRLARGEYILLLNPDTIVAEDTFLKCVEFMDNHVKCGGLGIKMIDGSGSFLPESKRGFPSPFVAFCKTFGLSTLFPTSKIFNQYHLGFLDKNENHPVDVLAGAYMMLRKSVIDEIGMLDETFFMYGEDIDWSYRIQQAGYENYYFADSSIIHYKGESTKKGSLNYVKVFYQAMIIFAKKHFTGSQGKFFVAILQLAIYFRASLTLFSNLAKKLFFPVLDASLIILGLVVLKDFWANYYFKDANYYDESFLWVNIPLYTSVWLISIFFNGGYDNTSQLRRPFRGLFIGTILLSAIYGFLNEEFRSSRMLIMLGAVWSLIMVLGNRLFWHFIQYKNFKIGTPNTSNLIIVGSNSEIERTLRLLQQAQINKNIIGSINITQEESIPLSLGNIDEINVLVPLYNINEIIFCSKDMRYKDIIQNMEQLGNHIQYRILPEGGNTIIGSHSKNTTGDVYTIHVAFNLSQITLKRNKRILDISICLMCSILFPVFIFIVQSPLGLLKNIGSILLGKKTWVGYQQPSISLPKIRPSVLHPLDAHDSSQVRDTTIQKLDFFYAKDYSTSNDLQIIKKGIRMLGR